MKTVMTSLFGSAATRCAACALGLALSSVFSAQASEIQSLTSIQLQAESYIVNYPYESPYPPTFKLGHLDSRLRLRACREPLSIEFSRRDLVFGNTALMIRCPIEAGWKIHLPVRIDVFDDVVVASKAMLKGQKIDESAITFQKHNIARLKNGYYSKNSALQQLQARRNLVRGAVLTPSNLSPLLMVRSGQQVTLVLSYNGLQIKSTGKALQSATLGQLVRVRNSQSLKIVEGVVAGEGLVRISI
jgi:flagella basal body P-ring formation protein FlgA